MIFDEGAPPRLLLRCASISAHEFSLIALRGPSIICLFQGFAHIQTWQFTGPSNYYEYWISFHPRLDLAS